MKCIILLFCKHLYEGHWFFNKHCSVLPVINIAYLLLLLLWGRTGFSGSVYINKSNPTLHVSICCKGGYFTSCRALEALCLHDTCNMLVWNIWGKSYVLLWKSFPIFKLFNISGNTPTVVLYTVREVRGLEGRVFLLPGCPASCTFIFRLPPLIILLIPYNLED